MAGLSMHRIGWLIRRVGRIYPAEIPYRVASVLRSAVQARGWFDAKRVPTPASDAKYGAPWVQVPSQGTVVTAALSASVKQIFTEGVPVFDVRVPLTNSDVDWNRDPKTGTDIGRGFGLAIDFRHIAGGVDIKYLWEINRHIWWVPFAQAYALTGELCYLETLQTLLDSWLKACPYPLGANWSSPVEHGIRLINWSIVWHLIGGVNSPMFANPAGAALRTRWLDAIYQHIRFASDNYSKYSSADNHLIGEAAGLFVAAHTWNLWADVRQLRNQAKQILEAEVIKQFSSDGVNTEQAICYHKFSFEFLLAAMLAGENNGDGFSRKFKTRMQSAIEFVAAMMDCAGKVPAIGDSDDGKVFEFTDGSDVSGYESMLRAGSIVLHSAVASAKLRLLGRAQTPESLWFKVPPSLEPPSQPIEEVDLPTKFPVGGYFILGKDLHRATELRVTMDVGPMGSNKIAGHGHADALAVLMSMAGQDYLVDPGTYCYNAAPAMRQYFRGTSAHNTVLIDRLDQSVYGGSFLWLRDVNCKVHSYSDDGNIATVEASHDGYLRLKDPLKHVRMLVLDRTKMCVSIQDRFECAQRHQVSLGWHFAPECTVKGVGATWTVQRTAGELTISVEHAGLETAVIAGENNPPDGWLSTRFYQMQPSPVLVSKGTIGPGTILKTNFTFTPATTGSSIDI